ncbi:hypothetical protein M413DRAFT_449241 [Hebeloma cylindrosporum]|uniref:Uncharacterized protein n=1 Tax=Hebeloma cylindrosporum TaxID=76867 RepID=A0A0C2Y5N6_HEBCY|nr:hypothetical protein M413DRAFT_449241 [Hebeloma cylindrosporum h7]
MVFEANQNTQDGGSSGHQQFRSESGSPFSVVENVEAGLASPITISLSQGVEDAKKPAIPLIAVDSFLPLLKTLPALVFDESIYHLRGAISKSELQNLSAYAQTIGEFALNSKLIGDEQHDIALGALMRLAQLKIHHTPGPLLPSLKQLRVIEPNESSISQLSLFFTGSLRTLKATGIPNNQQSTFLSFLITLAGEAPLLSSITLGPGLFTARCLNACLKFDHLRHFELLDAASSIDFYFLVAIGGLRDLETFILDARTATYVSPRSDDSPSQANSASIGFFSPSPYPSHLNSVFGSPSFPPQGPKSPGLGSLFGAQPRSLPPNPTCEPINVHSSSEPDEIVGRFSRLKRLDIIGSLPLICDLYEHVISADLGRLGMTLVQNSPSEAQKGKAKKALPSTPSKIDKEIDLFFSLIKHAVEERWPLTLRGVRLGHIQEYRDCNSDPIPAALPFTTFTLLLKHEAMENLEIAGWTLPYNSEKKHPIDEILEAALPNLNTIHLPIGGPTPGIQFAQLLFIIRAFPKLVSLQCGFEQPGTCPIPPIHATDVPPHGLKVLSVGHQDSAIDEKRRIRIASFLDMLFPHLERIETHARHQPETWAYIYELIKMCQESRSNHANRLYVSSGIQLSLS